MGRNRATGAADYVTDSNVLKQNTATAGVETELVLRLFEGLSIRDVAGGRSVSLAELDRQLQEWHEQEGISMNKFKEIIRAHAICLGDCKAYHSQKALKQALQADPSKIVSKRKAKRYKFVKKCLTIL